MENIIKIKAKKNMTLGDIEKELQKELVFRSCWNCNSAHEHLKKGKDFIICCFECGKLYIEGKELVIEEE